MKMIFLISAILCFLCPDIGKTTSLNHPFGFCLIREGCFLSLIFHDSCSLYFNS